MEEIQDIEITEIQRLTNTIFQKYKYDFSGYALSSFKRRVIRIMNIHKLENVDQLTQKLLISENFFHKFLSDLTVNVTEMFRDPSFWEVLKADILPCLNRRKESIRIWHAGCSSGEEVYSMTIALQEMGILEKTKIIATDIDQEIISKARKGKFSLKSMEVNEKNYQKAGGKNTLSDYYTIKGDYAHFDLNLTKNVIFKEQNLTQNEDFAKFDLILCRNVLIYFNQTLQDKVIKNFLRNLIINGFLIIGSKESLIWCEDIDKFHCIDSEEKIYKKIKA